MASTPSTGNHALGALRRIDTRRLASRRRGNIVFLLLPFLLILAIPDHACAYIGPGAGFVVIGSFLVMFTAVLSAVFTLFTWPLRYLIRSIRGRRAFARSRIKRFVILGLDGMDPTLAEKYMAEGKLPNFSRLRARGCFKRLESTVPSVSPVAWSTFQTGSNPGKHNIFDFLTRDKASYRPKLSSVDIRAPLRTINVGKYQLPIGKPDIRLLRKGKPFWKNLGEIGIFSSVIRVPITFPPEKFRGVQLSGMCVPDLRGTQGMFSFYTTGTGDAAERTGGESFHVTREGDTIAAELVGPTDPFRRDNVVLRCPFTVTIEDDETADIGMNGERHRLTRGAYTEWIRIVFKASLGARVAGICKFLLYSVEPEFRLYVTPINIDPEKPAMPVSHPTIYSTYLAKRQGSFATLGLAEDSWALNEKVLSDDDFIRQCESMDVEREKMFFDSLDKVRHGLCVCVFDGTDRIQHAFWRDIDEEHPARRERGHDGRRNAIAELYRRMDELLGRTMARCTDRDTVFMVISDHGFNSFRFGVDLNRWLEENGYLTVDDKLRNEKYLAGVDWSETRAFAVGLAGIYLNLAGRESRGIVDPGEEAALLRDEIAEKLLELTDPARGRKVVKRVYNALKVYRGPYKGEAPDLIVGYHRDYRASWETAVGQITHGVIHDNIKAWSGDHGIDRSLVPGVLFCNRPIDADRPRLMDIGPTVLEMFGVDVPKHMDGKPLTVADADGEWNDGRASRAAAAAMKETVQ